MSYDVIKVERHEPGRVFAIWGSNCPVGGDDSSRPSNEDETTIWAMPNAVFIFNDGIWDIVYDLFREAFLEQDPDTGEIYPMTDEDVSYYQLWEIGKALQELYSKEPLPTLGEVADAATGRKTKEKENEKRG